jgi:tight adherence protein C
MSNLFLLLALVGTFSAIVMIGYAATGMQADRRRAVEMLQAQVPEMTNVRRIDMTRPFTERAVVPFVGALGDVAKRITPLGMRERIARQLVLAGSPPGMDANKVAAMKVFGSLAGVALGVGLALLAGIPHVFAIFGGAFMGLFGYLLPGAGLGQRAIHRQDEIRSALPDTMDLLTISVEAGLGFDAALAYVRKNVPGPLTDEFSRMLQEMQIGVSRTDALRHLADRSDVPELKGFVLAMVQADTFGISVAKVLRAQALELRTRRRQRAEEKAQKVAVKLLFPLLIGFLPALFIVILGPALIKILHSLFHISF